MKIINRILDWVMLAIVAYLLAVYMITAGQTEIDACHRDGGTIKSVGQGGKLCIRDGLIIEPERR